MPQSFILIQLNIWVLPSQLWMRMRFNWKRKKTTKEDGKQDLDLIMLWRDKTGMSIQKDLLSRQLIILRSLTTSNQLRQRNNWKDSNIFLDKMENQIFKVRLEVRDLLFQMQIISKLYLFQATTWSKKWLHKSKRKLMILMPKLLLLINTSSSTPERRQRLLKWIDFQMFVKVMSIK